MTCVTTPRQPLILPPDLIAYAKSNLQSNYLTCVGATIDGTLVPEANFLATWNTNTCNFFLDGTTTTIQTETMNFIIERYFSQQNFSTSQYNIPEPENNILNICVNYPGSCQQAQIGMCEICTPSQVSGVYGLIRFCGCVIPVDPSLQQFESQQCSALCANSIAIPTVDNNNNVLECNEAVCVMNQINIEAVNTTFNNTTISQVCGNCINQSCKCFIDVSLPNVAQILGVSGNNDTFKTYCPEAVCYTVSSSGQTTNVPCSDYDIDISRKIILEVPKNLFWWVLFTFILLTLILITMFYWSRTFGLWVWEFWKPELIKE